MSYINHKYVLLSCLTTIMTLALSACQSDSFSDWNANVGDEVIFMASINEPYMLGTRTPIEDSTTYIARDKYDTEFYMILDTEIEEQGITNPYTAFGTYMVSSGYEGRLDAVAGSQPLNWKSLRGSHDFTGWTFPSGDYLDYGENPYKNFNTLDRATLPSAPIEFKNSPEGSPYKNNEIYETLIATKKENVSYIPDGTYVPLNFKHLVSKIRVDSIVLFYAGSKQEHLQCDLTFYGMPNKGTFYPAPDGGGEPVVITTPANYDDELTYYITSDIYQRDYFWIPPEVDFSDVTFSVTINSTEMDYNDMKEFSGSFKNVKFERSGVNWDNMNPDGSPAGDDTTILHAGEMMALKIYLYPGGGAGLSIVILPWSTKAVQESVHHAHNGIYNENELAEVLGADSSTIDEIYQLYGNEDNVFDLYGNLTFSSNNLTVPEGYTLDGNGHLITSTKSPLNIRNVKNVYIAYNNSYFYIDEEGNVYKVNVETFETVGTPIGKLTDDKTSSLNFTTGTLT